MNTVQLKAVNRKWDLGSSSQDSCGRLRSLAILEAGSGV